MLRLMSVLRASLQYRSITAQHRVQRTSRWGRHRAAYSGKLPGTAGSSLVPAQCGRHPRSGGPRFAASALNVIVIFSLRDQQRKRLSRMTTWSPSDETVAAVPEHSTWAVMILGFAGIGFMTYRRSLKAVTNLINEISEDPSLWVVFCWRLHSPQNSELLLIASRSSFVGRRIQNETVEQLSQVVVVRII